MHGPDHVTDSFGCGSGFQTLHGLFVVVIQSGGAGLFVWARAWNVTKSIAAVAMMAGRFIGGLQSSYQRGPWRRQREGIVASPCGDIYWWSETGMRMATRSSVPT